MQSEITIVLDYKLSVSKLLDERKLDMIVKEDHLAILLIASISNYSLTSLWYQKKYLPC